MSVLSEEQEAMVKKALAPKKEQAEAKEAAAQKFVDSLQKICDICEIPTLRQYGIDKDEYYQKIGKMAEDAVASGSPANTVKPVSVDDCKQLYKKLYT